MPGSWCNGNDHESSLLPGAHALDSRICGKTEEAGRGPLLSVIYGLPLLCKQEFQLRRNGSAVIYPASLWNVSEIDSVL